ncbi:MAG: hypothetical protein CMN75_03025, partial [Spirochaeta sp.]|nr:hypothetical protein [Spirochaeta sp.]
LILWSRQSLSRKGLPSGIQGGLGSLPRSRVGKIGFSILSHEGRMGLRDSRIYEKGYDWGVAKW